MNFEQVVNQAIFPQDGQQQKTAEAQLISMRCNQTQDFFFQLTKYLTDEQQIPQIRQFCGTLLKSSARQIDPNANKFLWLLVNDETRKHIKEALLNVLVGQEELSSKAAADSISTILTIEEPLEMWPDLIKSLGENANSNNEIYKKASIMTLGYICEKFKALKISMKKEKQDAVLVGICYGMGKDNQNLELRLTSINALRDALCFLEEFMKQQSVRDFVLNLLVLNFQTNDPKIQKACYQCLIEYCKVQYDTLEFLIQGFFNISKEGFVSQSEDVVISAIEVWNTIAQEYKERLEYNERLKKQVTQEQPLKAINYIEPVFEPLIQFLLQLLLKVSNDKDESISPIQEASERCLCSISEIMGNSILNTFTAFISNTHDKPEWQYKQASCLAFSSMLEGPEQSNLSNLIIQAMSKFVYMLQDQNDKVKESAAKLLNKISELFPECYFQSNAMNQDLLIILNAMQGPAKVSRNICWIICFLSEQMGNFQNSFIMQSVGDIIKALITNAVRQDFDNEQLSVIDISFMGIMNILYSSRNSKTARDYLDTSMTLFGMLAQFPEYKRETLKNGLLATIHSALLCLQQDFKDQTLAQNVYTMIINHFQLMKNVDSSGLYVLAALATCLKSNFVNILDMAWKYVEFALGKPEDKELFATTIGTIADIARACQDQFYPKLGIIETLMQFLEKKEFDKDLKLQIFLSIGDIILVCKEKCNQYIPKLMDIYQFAFTACQALLYNDKQDPEFIEYGEQLQEHLVESYTCMIHGINDQQANAQLIPYFQALFQFLEKTTNPQLHPQIEYLKNVLQLIVDLANFYNQSVVNYVNNKFVLNLIDNLKKHSKTPDTATLISYAEQILSQLFK